MKKIIFISIGVLVLLLIILVFLIRRNSITIPYPESRVTPTITLPVTSPTLFPEYQLPTPESLAPEEDLNAYDKLPKDQQEYSSLVLSLPIQTQGYSVTMNYANSTFNVTILSEKGMYEYQSLRQQYPNLKDSKFVVLDKR